MSELSYKKYVQACNITGATLMMLKGRKSGIEVQGKAQTGFIGNDREKILDLEVSLARELAEKESPTKATEGDDIYVSHKKVKRTPMTREEYNHYRGWKLPSDENGADAGYLVEYLDGGGQNHPDHEGYISWSPKEQFDNGYTKVEPVKKTTFQERVIAEKFDLDSDRRALQAFLNTELYASLHEDEKLSQNNQLIAMTQYSQALGERIERF